MIENSFDRHQRIAEENLSRSSDLDSRIFFLNGKTVEEAMAQLNVSLDDLRTSSLSVGHDLFVISTGKIRITADAVTYEERLLHNKKQHLIYRRERRPHFPTATHNGFMSDEDVIGQLLRDREE